MLYHSLIPLALKLASRSYEVSSMEKASIIGSMGEMTLTLCNTLERYSAMLVAILYRILRVSFQQV